MQKLLKLLQKLGVDLEYSLQKEREDRQYIAISLIMKTSTPALFPNQYAVKLSTGPRTGSIRRGRVGMNEKKLFMIVCNALICYQLSSTGEDYWEEFSREVRNKKGEIRIKKFFEEFFSECKGNRRLQDVKLKRLDKIVEFEDEFYGKLASFKSDFVVLQEWLASKMKQKKSAKTIVFAVKMFYYAIKSIDNCRLIIDNGINIPIDSRLTKIFEEYSEDYDDPETFYKDLSRELGVPQLHLDAVLYRLK